ncbi:GLPGLI family protein [Sediminibacterium roseum]|uniref:GLPGLI family protein n=1 Tax=Sediminibacterium roseum TaxID=1978412 RepID=A0ABW9ZWN8_9BACT|nr:GLPGLI family protein [Sediminibacterium roseum]NCI50127.1 GLPGLI family protein [Sediminibacterium roseum]
MCKKILCVLILLSAIQPVFCQDNIKIMLEFKMVHVVDTTQPANPRITPCMLLAGSRRSLYDDYYRTLRYLGYTGIAVDRIYNDAYEIQDAKAGITCDQVYTDFEKQKQVTGSYFSNALYGKEEPLPKLDWSILPQKKQILEQECQMATTTFKGRRYTAWFAPAIPINAGPWKLQGLPGIILAANDDRNEISFTCTKISMPEKKAPPIVPAKKMVLVSVEKFNKTKKAFDRDPKAAMGMSADQSAAPKFMSISPAGMASERTKTKPRAMNNTIEKEQLN